MLQKLRSVQVLRGVAACAVVVLHAYGWQRADGTPFRLGAAGVDLFFVISGFIMATIPKKGAGEFLSDRVWRIYPIWLIAMVPWLYIYPPDWRGLIASFTLWPSYPNFVTPALPLGWTLSFEMLFYGAYALAILTRPALPIFLLALSLAGRGTHPLFDYFGNPMIFEFLFGVLIARLPRNEAAAPWAIVAGLLMFACSPLHFYTGEHAISGSFHRVLTWGLASALIVYGTVSLERLFDSARFSVLLGDASYSIYLFHMLAIRALDAPWPVELVAAIGFGIAAYLVVERRIIEARRQLRLQTVALPFQP